MTNYSPLRYPGGKGKIVPYFKQVFRDNHLCDGVYVEPYAGGASVALSLLLDGYASKVIINDIDRSIFAFWHAMLNETDKFCARIENTPVTIKIWKEQTSKQRLKAKCNLLDLGFSTFFLNRTNRSGILSGGVIGGLKQAGDWKINARYNKEELIRRIERIARYRKRIELHNLDALELIGTVQRTLPAKSLIYLDPPYYIKGRALYLNHYAENDHRKIFEKLQKIKRVRWIVTYDDVKAIRDMYARYKQKRYGLQYSACTSTVGQEMMIFSDNLQVTKSPVLIQSIPNGPRIA